MEARIVVNMDNAAFEEPGGATELGRILRRLADEVEQDGAGAMERHTLRDFNGNRVGWLEIVE